MEGRIGSAGEAAAAYAGELEARYASAGAVDGTAGVLARAPAGRSADAAPSDEMPFQAERPPRPALSFALPLPMASPAARAEAARVDARDSAGAANAPPATAGTPRESTPDGSGPAGGGAARADARAVADRVYELMRQEARFARQRGLGRRYG